MGLSAEIRFDGDGFRTDFQLDLMEKYRGILRKTGIWNLEAGINYTITASEIGTQMIEKLANKTLCVVTTPVKNSLQEQKQDFHFLKDMKDFV